MALKRLCIKVGRGQGDGDIGTRAWGLGTWERETRDLRTSSMGREDVWDGDVRTSNTGTQGTRDYRKSWEVNAISVTFLVKATHPAPLRVPPWLFTKRRLGEDSLH